jgi:hypothetical protein
VISPLQGLPHPTTLSVFVVPCQAVAVLPSLQVLGSLTPLGRPLRSSTALPGGDLVGRLAAVRHLVTLDVSVVEAAQVAGLGGCSALTALTVR